MSININLLEEKERRNMLPWMVCISTFLLISVVLGAFFIQKNKLMEEADALAGKSTSTQEEQQPFQDFLDGEGQEREQLQKSLQQLNEAVVPAILVLQELSAALPERGTFQSFTMEGSSEIQIEAVFDTIQEAAQYLDELKRTDLVLQVDLVEMVTPEGETTLSGVYSSYTATYIIKLDVEEVRKQGGNEQ